MFVPTALSVLTALKRIAGSADSDPRTPPMTSQPDGSRGPC
ncbi:hypothetical protein [Alloactinosynnema sp. L-07]|nr:hypothetical protein [Alloactinosynnema sp. L-07]